MDTDANIPRSAPGSDHDDGGRPLDDESAMGLALEEAATAVRHGDVPVGAVAVVGGRAISSRHNERELREDPTAHAEMLALTQAVDDTAWPTGSHGALYSTDSTNDAVDLVPASFFGRLPLVAATPCDANGAPATCPGPGYPANYLATLNPWTGQVTRVTVAGAPYVPQGGLVFVPSPSWERP